MGSVEEHALPTVEPEETRLLFRLDASIHRAVERLADKLQIMWSRRHPDTNEEVDFELRLRELEGQIERDQLGFRMRNYQEKGPDKEKEPSWRDWIITIVGGLIVVGIGGMIYQLSELKSAMAASLARQEMDEQRISRLETHVYRGNP